jgi:hypothetical protein
VRVETGVPLDRSLPDPVVITPVATGSNVLGAGIEALSRVLQLFSTYF